MEIDQIIFAGDELTMMELAKRANATYVAINMDFRADVLDALTSGELILTENRKFALPEPVSTEPSNQEN